MRRCFAALLAGACALLGSVASAQQAPTARTSYEEVYEHTIDAVAGKYLHSRSVDWQAVKKFRGGPITNEAELRKALDFAFFAVGDPQLYVLTPELERRLVLRQAAGRGGYGISFETLSKMGSAGITLTGVDEGSTAEDAGLKVGDRVLAIDGRKLAGEPISMANAMLQHDQTGTVTLQVISNGVLREVVVRRDLDGALGINWRETNPVQLPYVAAVSRASPAEQAGLQQNDTILAINGIATRGYTAEDMVRLMDGSVGKKVVLTVQRGSSDAPLDVQLTRGVLPDFDTVYAEGQHGGGLTNSPYNSWARIKIVHFDWQGGWAEDIIRHIDDQTTPYKAMVLDLQGTSGDNADAAAMVAARFVDSGDVLRLKLGNGNDVVYSVRDGNLVKVESGSINATTVVGPHDQSRARLVVLVDPMTSGVATALVRTLSNSGRAEVIGLWSGNGDVVNDHITVDTPHGAIVVHVPSAHVVELDGSRLAHAWANHLSLDPSYRQGLTVLAGDSLWLTPGRMIWELVFGFFIVVLMWRLIRRRIYGEPEPVVEEEAPAPVDTTQGGDIEASRPSRLVAAAMLVVLLVGFPGFLYFLAAPPFGAHGQVEVELYVDGSPESEQRLATFNAVRQEMHGAITFKVIDVREHPEVLEQNQYGYAKVNFVPFLWTYNVWYDRHDKEIDRGGSGSSGVYRLTKRGMIQGIRSSATNYKQFWPNVEITRERPQTP